MCGICGFAAFKEIENDDLKRMNDTMYHRGPNDKGLMIKNINGVCFGLAQRRLSILDLSEAGHQPMVSSDQRYVIVFNGEIYNYREIRKEIIEKTGLKFKSDCDTEVLLEGYCLWGEEIVKKCNGMFAFAILDLLSGQLFLGRDRLGVKPLYYYYDNHELVFASELKAIEVMPGITLDLNTDVLPEYLYHGFISGEQTIYKKVYRLLPGYTAVYKDGLLVKKSYWNIPHEVNTGISYTEAKQTLKEYLLDSVRLRLIADVPVGSFLSGGIDSSLISAYAQKVSNKPIDTYTISFEERQYDESDYAQQIAEHLHTNHHVLKITNPIFKELVDDMVWYYDEPFADPSQIPTMLISKFARQYVAVSLSGDAGDELFGGYNTYSSIYHYLHYKRFGKLSTMLTDMPIVGKKMPYRFKLLAELSQQGEDAIQLWSSQSADLVRRLLKGNKPVLYSISLPKCEDEITRRMYLDCKTYLPDDILVKVDRASMKYSLETRCPLLDYRIVEYAFSLKQEFKFAEGIQKRILKDLLFDEIPKELFDRPKHGFGISIGTFLKNTQKDLLKYYTEKDFLERQGIFDYNEVNNLITSFYNSNSNERIVWSYFVFQMWYTKHLLK